MLIQWVKVRYDLICVKDVVKSQSTNRGGLALDLVVTNGLDQN